MKVILLVVALSLVAAFSLGLSSESKHTTQRQASLDAKCAAEATNPTPQFKRSLACVGLTRKFDRPMPAQG